MAGRTGRALGAHAFLVSLLVAAGYDFNLNESVETVSWFDSQVSSLVNSGATATMGAMFGATEEGASSSRLAEADASASGEAESEASALDARAGDASVAEEAFLSRQSAADALDFNQTESMDEALVSSMSSNLSLGDGLEMNQTVDVNSTSNQTAGSNVNASEVDAFKYLMVDNTTVSLGASVNLTDDGYDNITNAQDVVAMMVFVKRLLDNGARVVSDVKGLQQFARRHTLQDASGEEHNLTTMKQELSQHNKTWWVVEGAGKTAPLNTQGFERMAAMNDRNQMRAFLRRVVNSLGLEIVNNNMVDNLAAELGGAKVADRYKDLCELLRLPRFTRPGAPVNAEDVPLTEDGYARLASENNDQKMAVFVKRVLATEGRSIKEESGLSGFVPYFSGTIGKRDLQSMRLELREPRHTTWVDAGLGRSAPLDEQGFSAVAATQNSQHMKAFIRRLATVSGTMMMSEGELSGMTPFFSGERANQTFVALLRAVANAKQSAPSFSSHSSGRRHKRRLRHRRSRRHHSYDTSSLDEFGASFLQVSATEEEGSGLGASAPLNDDGYGLVLESDDVGDMKDYIKRVLVAEAREVKDSSGLTAFATSFSSNPGTNKLAGLKQELRSHKNDWWLADGVGKTAPLSEEGYQSVVAANSDKQMKAFMRRVVKSEGQAVVNEGMLSGLVPFFSGKKQVNTFRGLKRALQSEGVTGAGI